MSSTWAPRPDDLLTFVELDEFRDDWQRIGLDIETDLSWLQWQLMEDPQCGDLVRGAGGLRKARFAPPGSGRGKRSSVRICYAYFEKHHLVLLMMAYDKSSQSDLTAAEKRGVARYLDLTEQWLAKGSQRKRKR